jgi:hypothetical protein
MTPDIRWQQRFSNFSRAFALLREALERGPHIERVGIPIFPAGQPSRPVG